LENEEDTTVGTEPEETVTKPTESKPAEGPSTTRPSTQQTQPTGQGKVPGNTVSEQSEIKKPFQLPDWIKTVFWSVLGIALVQLQSDIRIAWKRKRWNRGKANEKTITRWKQTGKEARIMKLPYPEELDALAQKATFSQHRIQTGELQSFDAYRKSVRETVRSKPWYQRVILRWIFAIH